jgi:phospholipase/lecithinase/hemolysin
MTAFRRLSERLFDRFPAAAPLPMQPTAATVSHSIPRPGRRLRNAWALAAATLLAACGGSTTQFDPFVAQRVISFGDEASVITANGRYWSVNGLKADNLTLDCSVRPIWIQQVAGVYGFVFAGCNPNNIEVKAFTYAVAGARVSDLAAQINTVVAAGGFREKDLITAFAGVNDIVDLYRQFPATGEAALVAAARERGRQMALVVNGIVALGGRVIVSNIPDMQFSALAAVENAANPGSDRAALLGRMSRAFNEQLGVSVLLDGRFVGLAQLDLTIQAMGRSPASFGLVDISTPICIVALPECTTATLRPFTDANTYLWADETRMSSVGQNQLGSLAADRARRNPF